MSSRRTFLKQGSLLAVGGRAAGPASFMTGKAGTGSSAPVIETTFGKLRGRSENGVHVFRGIPYGADTSGRNRFMPPQKPAPWQGIREAQEWGRCAP